MRGVNRMPVNEVEAMSYNLVLLSKQCGSDTVHWGISPTLFTGPVNERSQPRGSECAAYLVIESALLIQEVKELAVRLAPP